MLGDFRFVSQKSDFLLFCSEQTQLPFLFRRGNHFCLDLNKHMINISTTKRFIEKDTFVFKVGHGISGTIQIGNVDNFKDQLKIWRDGVVLDFLW